MAGVNIKHDKIINFTICGTMAVVAGILLSVRLGTAEPSAGKIWVTTLAVLRNGLRLLNTPNYVELMVMGAVLIPALMLDSLLSRRMEA